MPAETEQVAIEEQLLTFGVSGRLVMNVLVMYDRETDSYWSQLLGEAIDGPLNGAKLTTLPAVQTTWGQWKEQFPETKALITNGAGSYDTYARYYTSSQAGVLGEARQDDRLPVKEKVAGVLVNGTPIAYPHSRLAEKGVVNDEVNGVPVAVVFDAQTATAQVFKRTVGDRILTFASGSDPLEFTDNESGSTWLLLTGKAIDGELAGEILERIPGTNSFWFGWKDFYPDTMVYGE